MRCAQRHSLSLRGVGAAATRQSSPAAVSRRGALLAGGIALSLPTRTLAAAAAPTGAADILRDPKWPESFPFGASELGRYDETEDSAFYSAPRFVTHMDDGAIAALTAHYAKVFPKPGPGVALLDVCSSWISHYPEGYSAETCGRVSGLGMNEDELKRNRILSDFEVRDLNKEPTLPYADNTFDVVTNAVSVDYLTKPLEMMKEVQRVLKAIAIWTSTGDLDHIWIVGSYFHFAGGFTAPEAVDISPKKGGDPMYVVFARKQFPSAS